MIDSNEMMYAEVCHPARLKEIVTINVSKGDFYGTLKGKRAAHKRVWRLYVQAHHEKYGSIKNFRRELGSKQLRLDYAKKPYA